MAPGTISKFGAPMFEPEVFPKQMCCFEESTCDIVGPFRRPGNCAHLIPPHYAPLPCIYKLHSCINTAPLPEALSRACYASTTKRHDKTGVVACYSTTVRHWQQERSVAISTRPRPSHAIRKDKSVRTAAFQARRYLVRIWLKRV